MAHTADWNAAAEASPADSDNASAGAGKVRDFRRDIRERVQTDHYFDLTGTQADHGEHKKVTLRELAADPTKVTDKGFLYTKNDGGDTELYYMDAGGNVIQFSTDGALVSAFASGTAMWFYQNSAPTGWTYSSGVTDRVLSVKGGSNAYNANGGTVAGSWTPTTHTHTGTSHSHTLGGHTHSFTASAHTHTGPSHAHTGPSHTHAVGSYAVASHNHKWLDITASTSVYDKSYNSGGTLVNVVRSGAAKVTADCFSVQTTSRYSNQDLWTQKIAPSMSGSSAAGGTGNTSSGGTGATSSTGVSGTTGAASGSTAAGGTGATGSGSAPATDRPAGAIGIICTKD